MGPLFNILMIEDSEDDALLLIRELEKIESDILTKRVDTPEALMYELKNRKWDLILSDYVMPSFNGIDALKIVKEYNKNLPFILVSGAIEESVAAEAIKRGANDYVMKGNLSRLTKVIEEMKNSIKESQTIAQNEYEKEGEIINYPESNFKLKENGKTFSKLISFFNFDDNSRDKRFIITSIFIIIFVLSSISIINDIEALVYQELQISKFHFISDVFSLFFILILFIFIYFILKKINISALLEIELRKKNEETNAFLAAIIESSEDAIFSKKLDGNITSWNKGAESIFGYKENEIIGKSIKKIIPGNKIEEFDNIIEKVINGITYESFETKRIKKDGTVIDVSSTISPIKNSDGKIIGASSISRDIRKQKKLEEVLHSMSLYTRSLIEASRDPLVTISTEGIITDLNKAMEEATGISRNELIGINFAKVFVETEKASQCYQYVIRDGFIKDYSLTIKHANGELMDVELNATVYKNELDELQGIFVTARDVTKRKKAEESIKAERQRFDKIMEMLPVFLTLTTNDYHISYANRFYKERFGEIDNKRCYKFLYNRNQPCLDCIPLKVLETKIPENWEWSAPDNKNYFVTCFPFKDIDERLLVLEMGIDITERKRAEEALRQSEQLLKTAQEIAQIGHWHVNLITNKLVWSDEIFRIVGLIKNGTDVCFDVYLNTVYSEDKELVKQAFYNAINNKINYDIEYRVVKPKGEVRNVHEKCYTNYYNSDNTLYLIGTIQDITDKKKSETELIITKQKAEESDILKSEFLAQMSHEIRTPVNIMLSFSSLIREEISDKISPEWEHAFFSIDKAGKRLIRTIDQILNMSTLQSGKYEIKLTQIDLYFLIMNLINEFKVLAEEKKLKISINKLTEETFIKSDEYLLLQIFQNIIDNAIKYTNAGKIEIIIYKNDLKNTCVAIEDTGIGISEEYISKMFKPFTQEDSGYSRKYEGVGLGMALVQNYLTLLNAEIKVSSEKGKGTQFTVIFND